jgi:cupin fold WbuC family metalloprotein
MSVSVPPTPLIAESATKLFDTALLDALSAAARANPRQRQNHNLHASLDAPVQRFFNAIEPASYVTPHRHLLSGKEETLLMVRGSLGLILFDAAGQIHQTHLLTPAGACCGFHLGLDMWHSVIALEPGTIFFETKTGPFVALGTDELAPWAPAPDSPGTTQWLEQMRTLFDSPPEK